MGIITFRHGAPTTPSQCAKYSAGYSNALLQNMPVYQVFFCKNFICTPDFLKNIPTSSKVIQFDTI